MKFLNPDAREFAATCWQLYIACLEQGFSAEQSMQLLKALISSHK